MPLDRRLRDALQDDAAGLQEPDVDSLLEDLERRARRRGPAPTVRVLIAAAIGALVLGSVTAVLAPRPAPTPVDPADRLAGTYRVTLESRDPGARAWALAGTWTLTLGTDSSVAVTPPDGFIAARGEHPGDAVHALRGDQLFIDLFARMFDSRCAGFGTYTWAESAGALRLTTVADGCEPRASLLTANPWVRDDDPAGERR